MYYIGVTIDSQARKLPKVVDSTLGTLLFYIFYGINNIFFKKRGPTGT